LVGRGGAVGDKKGLVRTEGPRRVLLCLLDRAVGLQQRVQAARGGGAFRPEDVDAVEIDNMPGPVRAGDRLAAGYGQGVKHAGGPAAVIAQGIEKWCAVALVNGPQDGLVLLDVVGFAVEDAVEETQIT